MGNMHLVQTCAHNTHCEVGMEFRVRISIDATLYPEDLISLPSNFNFRTFDAYTGGKIRSLSDVHFPRAFRELCQWRSVLFTCNHNRGRENGCIHCTRMNINVRLISTTAGHIVCACVCVCVCVCERHSDLNSLCHTLYLWGRKLCSHWRTSLLSFIAVIDWSHWSARTPRFIPIRHTALLLLFWP